MLTFWYFDIDIGTDIITEDGCCPYNDGHAAELYWKLALCFPRTSFFGDQPLCPWRRSHNPTTSPPVWKTCAPHWRSMLFWCHKCQMSKSLRPLPSRAGPLPRFPEEHPPAPRLGNDCKPNSQVLADPRLLVFRHPLSLATKVTSCTLMRNQISAQGHHLSQNDSGCCLPHSQKLPWTMLVVVSSQSGRWARLWRVELCPWSHVYKDVGIRWTTCWRAMNLPATMIHILEA